MTGSHLIFFSLYDNGTHCLGTSLYGNGQLVCTPALGLYLCVCVRACVYVCVFLCVHVTSNVELHNYGISRQIVIERRVT